MLRKYSLLFGIIISLILIIISTTFYPGGSQHDPNSIGYDWKNNYLSNLFTPKAINGINNPARYWAICGVLFLTTSFAIFFAGFSKKIPAKGAANVIKFCGISSTIFAVLVVTPFHDEAVRVSSVLMLLTMFYITVFILKSRLYLFKILSILNLLIFYACNYIYFTRNFLEILPVAQKVALLTNISLVICLHYFTSINDFQAIRRGRRLHHPL